jgi:hypothetical protein
MRTPLINLIIAAFLFTSIGPVPVEAQELLLPTPGTMVPLSSSFNPAILKGLKINTDDPFQFEFILDKGESQLADQDLKDESAKLIRYFMASLTVPETDLWVNLSPYEKDRIVPESFGQTDMGRDLLAQDYLLKQITASLIYPEGEVGKAFWKKVYEQASQKFGTDVPINTFNKVWIVPDKAVVYENAKAGTAYVVESSLKVMLEEDYLAKEKSGDGSRFSDNSASEIVRDVVIPQLTKEVNEGQNFAQLRQVYNSLILAAWYKKKIKDSILQKVYVDQKKTKGIDIKDSHNQKQAIYDQYLTAFKKGAFNFIKEEKDLNTQQLIPRKYFSGGVKFGDLAMSSVSEMTMGELPLNALKVLVHLKSMMVGKKSDYEIIGNASGRSFDIVYKGQNIGSILMKESGNTIYLEQIFIKPNHRNQGILTGFLSALGSKMREDQQLKVVGIINIPTLKVLLENIINEAHQTPDVFDKDWEINAKNALKELKNIEIETGSLSINSLGLKDNIRSIVFDYFSKHNSNMRSLNEIVSKTPFASALSEAGFFNVSAGFENNNKNSFFISGNKSAAMLTQAMKREILTFLGFIKEMDPHIYDLIVQASGKDATRTFRWYTHDEKQMDHVIRSLFNIGYGHIIDDEMATVHDDVAAFINDAVNAGIALDEPSINKFLHIKPGHLKDGIRRVIMQPPVLLNRSSSIVDISLSPGEQRAFITNIKDSDTGVWHQFFLRRDYLGRFFLSEFDDKFNQVSERELASSGSLFLKGRASNELYYQIIGETLNISRKFERKIKIELLEAGVVMIFKPGLSGKHVVVRSAKGGSVGLDMLFVPNEKLYISSTSPVGKKLEVLKKGENWKYFDEKIGEFYVVNEGNWVRIIGTDKNAQYPLEVLYPETTFDEVLNDPVEVMKALGESDNGPFEVFVQHARETFKSELALQEYRLYHPDPDEAMTSEGVAKAILGFKSKYVTELKGWDPQTVLEEIYSYYLNDSKRFFQDFELIQQHIDQEVSSKRAGLLTLTIILTAWLAKVYEPLESKKQLSPEDFPNEYSVAYLGNSADRPVSVTIENLSGVEEGLIEEWKQQAVESSFEQILSEQIRSLSGYAVVSEDKNGHRHLEGWISYDEYPIFGLYAKHLETAPWNRSELGDKRKFKGIGHVLSTKLLERSVELGYDGRRFGIADPSLSDGKSLAEQMGAVSYDHPELTSFSVFYPTAVAKVFAEQNRRKENYVLHDHAMTTKADIKKINSRIKKLSDSNWTTRQDAANELAGFLDLEFRFVERSLIARALIDGIIEPTGIKESVKRAKREGYTESEARRRFREAAIFSLGLLLLISQSAREEVLHQLLQDAAEWKKMDDEIIFINKYAFGHTKKLSLLQNLRLFVLAHKAGMFEKRWILTSIESIVRPQHPAIIHKIVFGDKAMVEKPFNLDWQKALEVPWEETVHDPKNNPALFYGTSNQENYQRNQLAVRREFLKLIQDLEAEQDIDTQILKKRIERMHELLLTGEDGKTLYHPLDYVSHSPLKVGGAGWALNEADSKERLTAMLVILKNLFGKQKNKDVDLIPTLAKFHQIALGGTDKYMFYYGNNSLIMNMVNGMLRLHGYNGISHGYLDHLPETFKGTGTKRFEEMVRAKNPGGIDLQSDKLDLEVYNKEGEIRFNTDPAMVKRYENAEGFTPVIISIVPTDNLPAFLGITSLN